MSEPSQRPHPLQQRAMACVDPASYSLFRAAFGLLMCAESVRFFVNDWIDAHLRGPIYRFTWPGFDWVTPLPGPGLEILFAALGVSALACGFGRGWSVRLASGFLALGWTYVLLLDQALFLNHHYLAILLCLGLVFLPVDRLPRWGLWWFRAMLVCVYFWAGISKLDSDWAVGFPLLMSLELSGAAFVLSDRALATLALVGSWGIIALEVGTPVLFAFRRTRYVAMTAYVAFHLATMVLYNIGIFPWMSLALLSLWLPEDWPRRWGYRGRSGTEGTGRHWGLYPALVLLVLQVLLPTRGLLSEGNPAWTMENARMNWRLLVSHKTGWVRYRVAVHGEDGHTEVSPLSVLTPWQASKMARNPQLIRQFGQWLSAEQSRRGLPPISVHAESGVSLNGRNPVPLVKAQVNLVSVTDQQALFSWVSPLTEPLPERPVHLDGDWWIDNMWGYETSLVQMTTAAEGGDQEAARAWMLRAMRLDPQRDTAPVLWIEGLRRAGRSEEAMAAIDRWMEAAPDHPKAWEQRGLIHAESGREVTARNTLEHAIGLDASFPLPRSAEALAHLAAQRGDANEAARWLGQLHTWEPQNTEAALSYAELLHRHLGRTPDAELVLRSAARHNPLDPRIIGALGALSELSPD